MKTHSLPSLASLATSSAKRFLLATLCALAVSFTAAPTLSAAAPNGEYKFVSASGSLTMLGETYELPQDMLRDLTAIQNSSLVIRERKLSLNRRIATRIINQLSEELGVPIEISISGPSSVTLRKSGLTWVGRTANPVVVTFSGSYGGVNFSGNLKANFNIVVRGRKLTMKVPVTGRILGYDLKANATVVCTR